MKGEKDREVISGKVRGERSRKTQITFPTVMLFLLQCNQLLSSSSHSKPLTLPKALNFTLYLVFKICICSFFSRSLLVFGYIYHVVVSMTLKYKVCIFLSSELQFTLLVDLFKLKTNILSFYEN